MSKKKKKKKNRNEMKTRKFYIRKNDKKVGSIFFAHFLPEVIYTFSKLMMIKFYRRHLVHKYNFACFLF